MTTELAKELDMLSLCDYPFAFPSNIKFIARLDSSKWKNMKVEGVGKP